MLTKFKNHLNTPITWGKYYKLAGGCFLISLVISAIVMLKCLYDWGYIHLSKFITKASEGES